MGQSFESLPRRMQARRYREMAEAACQLADNAASPQAKMDYLTLASAWNELALEMEFEIAGIRRDLFQDPPALH